MEGTIMTRQELIENVVACVRKPQNDGAVSTQWMDDLEVYFRIFVDGGSVVVTRSLLDAIGMHEQRLFDFASDHLIEQVSIRSLSDILGLPETPPEVKVATTTGGQFGAGVMTILNDVMDVSDKWIIPSSIHEVLLVDKDEFDEDDLGMMITSVNVSAVNYNDILSDHPYDGAKLDCVRF